MEGYKYEDIIDQLYSIRVDMDSDEDSEAIKEIDNLIKSLQRLQGGAWVVDE